MVPAQSKIICNSLDSTLRTALASFCVSDTEGIRLGDFECNGDVSPTTLSTYHKLHGGSLTCTRIPPNIPRLHDWPSHLSLPHRRKAGWRRDGRCLQGRRHLPGTVCRSEVSSRRGLPRCSDSGALPSRGACCL